MRRSILTLFASLFICVGCGTAAPKSDTQLIEGLTLEQKAAKLLIVGLDGTSLLPNNKIITDISKRGVSGVILFERNIAQPAEGFDPRQNLKKFITDLKAQSSTPIFVTIDQEGGFVNRMKTKYGFAEMLSQKKVGASEDVAAVEKNAQTIASEVASIGININFSPCVDVDVNPECPVIGRFERSFSADEKLVSKYADIYVDAHHKQGVLTSLKHFPGHGNSLVDSHFGLTDITNTWQRRELTPYADLIKSGKCDAVMVSHLFNSNFDPKYPATLSSATINGLLRNELGWDGVAISDDMQMKAIVDHYGFEEAIILGLNAGLDLFIIGGNIKRESFDIVERFISAIVDGVANGSVPQEVLDRAVVRVERLRERIK